MPQPLLPPLRGDERTMLLSFLDFYRAEFLDRSHGLTDSQLQTTLATSTLSLSRLIGHMAFVENCWFAERFDGLDMPAPFGSLNWEADRDAEMTLAQTWSGEKLVEVFQGAAADSLKRCARAESLDQLSVGANKDGEHWNLRWILIHMIEEYARHTGHADLIRESIDGDTAGP